MAAQAGKKKQKLKGTKMALTEFLSPDETASFGSKSDGSSWAAEMENVDFDDAADLDYIKPRIDRSKLPTAPKASRGPDVDMSRIPSNPPYTAFIGNLPYEATEEKIAHFFKDQKVVNVRLPIDNGRLRGFGYVEFEDKQSLIDSLALSDECIAGRKIRVDVAGQNQQGNDRGDNRRGGGGGDDDRTDSDWRKRDPDSDMDRRQNDGWGRSRDGDRDRGYDDRGPQRGGSYGDRGFDRGYDRGGDRGYDRDRGYRDRGYDNRGPPRGDDRYESRGRYDDRGQRGGYDDRRGYDNRRGGGGYGYDRDQGYNRGYDRDDGGRRGFGSGFRRDDDRFQDRRPDSRYERSGSPENRPEPPKERPRLNLQPRSKPVENNVPPPEPAKKKTSANIFGDAKPVDTATKEREIEERLQQQQRLDLSRREEEKENRNYHNSVSSSGSRTRHESQDSDRQEGQRQRRLSSNSSKGRHGPPPVTSPSRSRRDSEISNHSSGDVFSGSEEGTKDEPLSPKSPEEPPVKLVPAPAPTVNVWKQRKSENKPPAITATVSAAVTVNSPPPKTAVVSAASSPPKRDMSDSKSSNENSPQSTNAWKAKSNLAEPTENVWAKRAHDREQTGNKEVPGERGAYPGDRGQRRPFGRGEPSERGQGRGGRRPGSQGRGRSKGNKERPIPKSIDEMPKYEAKVEKDWSNTNKFAGLIDDDEEDNGGDS